MSRGRADIVTFVNRYGHCLSYTKITELDTALAYDVEKVDSLLPSNISVTGNIVSHLCWDNFDINEETPTGAGTTHTTHGIVIQEAEPAAAEVRQVAVQQRTRERSFKFVPESLQPCYTRRRVEPILCSTAGSNVDEKEEPGLSGTPLDFIAHLRGLLWSICLGVFNEQATVPDWNGWISMTTSNDDTQMSAIGYMKPILHPINEYATVQKCLSMSMDVSKKLNQSFTFVTFDYAAARYAYDIVWEQPSVYNKVIVHMGAFHLMCSYMGALGKMMAGSGFEDILIEAGVCTSGSINQVMSGAHYNRAIRVHQYMSDAVERLLLNRFTTDKTIEHDYLAEFVSLAEFPSFDKMVAVVNSASCAEFLNDYSHFRTTVREGCLGKTAQFWMMYCDCVWILLRFLEAIKENDLDMYIQSLRQLCGLMFSADHIHYARYLPVYVTQLSSVMSAHPEARDLLQKYGISVSRSNVPGCRNAIDLTIEQTINRSAKTPGGVIGFSRNINAYHRWCLTRHRRATYLEATREELGMLSECASVHKAAKPAEMLRSDNAVQNLVCAFNNFLNPFALPDNAKDSLFCLSSGQAATSTVTANLMQYVEHGNVAAEKFIKDRLVDKTTKFHDSLKKLSLSTFQSLAVSKAQTTSQKKVVQVKAQRNLLGQLLVLSKSNDINLDKLFRYPLAPIPWSLATADGGFMKTNKAQLMHHLESTIDSQSMQTACVTSAHCTFIVDGNALLQSLVKLPQTFGELAQVVIKCLPKEGNVHFVTDCYHQDSIKDTERLRRGSSAQFLIGGPNTKLPRDFGSFMCNADNKMQLVKFLLSEWHTQQYAKFIGDRDVYFVCAEECHRLHSQDGVSTTASRVPELQSSHEEADTRIILHCMYASQFMSDEDSIVVRSPDTDVFILLLHYSTEIGKPLFLDAGTGNTRRRISINSISSTFSEDVMKALPGFHAFTGADCTSAFVRKGKIRPFKIMCQSASFTETFKKIGSTVCDLPAGMYKELEHFVCCMYGHPELQDTNKVRSIIFQSRFGVTLPLSLSAASRCGMDLSLLPPCSSSLVKHSMRANYQAFVWKQAHVAFPDVPSPDGLGWMKDKDGRLQIDWIAGDMMPQNLLDILETAEDCLEITEEDDEVDNIIDIVFDEDV